MRMDMSKRLATRLVLSLPLRLCRLHLRLVLRIHLQRKRLNVKPARSMHGRNRHPHARLLRRNLARRTLAGTPEHGARGWHDNWRSNPGLPSLSSPDAFTHKLVKKHNDATNSLSKTVAIALSALAVAMQHDRCCKIWRTPSPVNRQVVLSACAARTRKP